AGTFGRLYTDECESLFVGRAGRFVAGRRVRGGESFDVDWVDVLGRVRANVQSAGGESARPGEIQARIPVDYQVDFHGEHTAVFAAGNFRASVDGFDGTRVCGEQCRLDHFGGGANLEHDYGRVGGGASGARASLAGICK